MAKRNYLEQEGYSVTSEGLITQWGIGFVSTAVNNLSYQIGEITFSIPFTSTVLNIDVTPFAVAQKIPNPGIYLNLQIPKENITLTNATVIGVTNNAISSMPSSYFMWTAIGV